MNLDTVVPYVAMACAGIGVISTVVYYVFKYKELRVMREIRDRLDRR